MNQRELDFLKLAVELSFEGMRSDQGGPFGAIVVKGDKVVGKGHNKVLATLDPTAHAEVVAIRDACKNLGSFQLEGCEVYTSCEPCPMCLGAIYWARPEKVYFGNTRACAADAGFDDSLIYEEIPKSIDTRRIPMIQIGAEYAIEAFREWKQKVDRFLY